MLKKILLPLLTITATFTLANNIRVDVDTDNENVEFFYEIHPLDKYQPIDKTSHKLLTYLQDEDQSYYNFQTDSIKEIKLKNQKRLFVVESPPSQNDPNKTLVIFIVDNKYSYTIKCAGPEKIISLTSGQCADLLHKSAKVKLSQQDVEKSIDQTPKKK